MLNKTLTKVFKLNDIKTILRVHVNLRIYIQSQEEEKLATHGSHENTIEKEKEKFLITTALQEIFQKMIDAPMFNLASLL